MTSGLMLAKLPWIVVKITAGVLLNEVLVRWQMTVKHWACVSPQYRRRKAQVPSWDTSRTDTEDCPLLMLTVVFATISIC